MPNKPDGIGQGFGIIPIEPPPRSDLLRTPPIFVVGMPRSGTTLLARLLESCGPYTALPESHFFSRFIWESAGRRSVADLRRAWKRFAASRNWPLETELDQPQSYQDITGGAPARYRAIFLEWITCELIQSGRSGEQASWVENSPPHLEGIPFICRVIPEARIIGMVRDPRAVHASLEEVDWNNATAAANGERWKWYLYCLEQWLQSEPQRFRLVRYEDLVIRPEYVLSELSQWLGIAPTEINYKLTDDRTACFDPVYEPWKVNALQAPDTSRIERWRDRLMPEQVVQIEYWTRNEMKRYGYIPESLAHTHRPLLEWYGVLRMRIRLRVYALATRVRLILWRCLSSQR